MFQKSIKLKNNGKIRLKIEKWVYEKITRRVFQPAGCPAGQSLASEEEQLTLAFTTKKKKTTTILPIITTNQQRISHNKG